MRKYYIDKLLTFTEGGETNRGYLSNIFDYVEELSSYVYDIMQNGSTTKRLPFLAGCGSNRQREQILLIAHLNYKLGAPIENSAFEIILTDAAKECYCFTDSSIWKKEIKVYRNGIDILLAKAETIHRWK